MSVYQSSRLCWPAGFGQPKLARSKSENDAKLRDLRHHFLAKKKHIPSARHKRSKRECSASLLQFSVVSKDISSESPFQYHDYEASVSVVSDCFVATNFVWIPASVDTSQAWWEFTTDGVVHNNDGSIDTSTKK